MTENPGSDIGMSMLLSVFSSRIVLCKRMPSVNRSPSITLVQRDCSFLQDRSFPLPVPSSPFLQFSLFSADAFAASESNRASQFYISVLSMKTLFLDLLSFAILDTDQMAILMINFTLSSTSVAHLTGSLYNRPN